MWEALANTIKLFLEKYLFPTILSVAISILFVLLLPSDAWIFTRVGVAGVITLAFCVSFSVIYVIVFLLEKHKRNKGKKEAERYTREATERHRLERLRYMWDEIDKMPPADKKTIQEFVSANNKYYAALPEEYLCSKLWEHSWIKSTTIDSLNLVDAQLINPSESFHCGGNVRLFRLRDDVFDDLKYSTDKYGKISNFDIL